jgi:GntR family transcriptional regulator, vanillate catabolism transcriptional regulator
MAKGRRFDRLGDMSLAEQAKQQIREAIFEGRIRAEERITIERIADELGISRTPVREALKALESDGVVRLIARRGAVISSFTKDEIFDRYSVRAMVEGYAGALACKRQPKSLAERLQRDCDSLERLIAQADPQALSVKALIENNTVFHDRILEASGSSTSVRILEGLRMPISYKVLFWKLSEHQARSLKWHRQIANAFEAEKPSQVRRLMEAHLLEARDYLLQIHDMKSETKTSGAVRASLL